MFVTTVPNPSAFGSSEPSPSGRIIRKDHQLLIRMYLQGVQVNGLMLVDSEGLMVKQIRSAVRHMTRESRLLAALAGPDKKFSRRIIRCLPPLDPGDISARSAVDGSFADALLMPPEYLQSAENDLEGESIPMSLAQYIDSEIEEKRRRYATEQETLDRMSPPDLRQLLGRLTGYSKSLAFYDPMIGKSHIGKLEGWGKGLGYILGIWGRARERCLPGHGDHTLEVYTKYYPREDGTADEVRARVTEHLIDPLSEEFRIEAVLYLKRDYRNGPIFHDRYLQTDSAPVLFGWGFDLFHDADEGEDGKPKRSAVQLMNGARHHLQEVRDLCDA